MWITVLGKGSEPGSPKRRQEEKGSSVLCSEFSRLGFPGIGKRPKTEMAGVSTDVQDIVSKVRGKCGDKR